MRRSISGCRSSSHRTRMSMQSSCSAAFSVRQGRFSIHWRRKCGRILHRSRNRSRKGRRMSMMLFTESEMAQLTAHLRKEAAERERAEQENQAISNLMEQYAEMSYLYQVEELTPPAEQQIESLRLVSFAEEMERSQQEEREIPAQDETPRIPGRWAALRREYLQSYRPKEWATMLMNGTAAAHLRQVQEETEQRYRTMYRQEEARQILGQNLRGLEEVQRSGMIEAQLREMLTAELAY
ncbi:TnpV protein [uncultured Selenomonas sp.]|uniref:TnpV protein n=2 Tax=Selenomonas TaxID=970 RepID=UPI0037DC29FD